MSEHPVIFAPNGQIVGSKANTRVELRAGVMEWFRQFADVREALKHQGLHVAVRCSKCQSDFVGRNADSDKVFSFTCGCTEVVGPNRDYRERPPQKAH